jgi:O-antigen ligase/tetratricopeptide (TPR) repeat protein
VEKLFLFLYLFIGLVPIFGAADQSITQVLYLQILNGIFILYFLFFLKRENKVAFVENLKSSVFILFLMFFCWSCLSIIVSVNRIESLRTLTLIATYLTSFPILYYLINQIKKTKGFFINMILSLLTLEILTVVSPYLYDVVKFGSQTYRSVSYSGLTGNINIAAFSILLKLPFAYYRVINSKKQAHIIFNFILIFFGILSIFTILLTRGAILGLLFISLLLIINIIGMFFRKKITARTLIKNFLLVSLPLIFNFILNTYQSQFSTDKDLTNLSNRLETVVDFKDTSKNQRLRYWEQSFKTGISNPIFGIGIGNWKLKGIETNQANMINYVVPYHSHNDFLEFFAETGIIGLLLYSAFIFFVLVALSYFLIKRDKTSPILFYLILAFIVYLIDASLNFPFARPIQQISFFSIFIYSIFILKKEFGFNDSFKYLKKTSTLNAFLAGIILIAPFSLYSSARIFNSSRQQYFMLGQFNLNIYNSPISLIESYEMDYPNISETTIPLNTFKAIYYLKAEKFQKAIDLFHKARKANPYLMINESYLSLCYSKLNKKDSSLYYSKKAFKNQPNNIAHFAHYVISLSMNNDSLEIKNAYNKIKKLREEPDIDKIYYLSMSNLLDKDDSSQFIDKTAKNLLQSNETDDLTRGNLYILKYGREKVLEADMLYEMGQKLFDEKKFLESAIKFEEAAKINPLELPYFENAANAYMQISKLEKALENINYVINNSKEPNGKAFYIKALVYIEKRDKVTACKLLKKSAQSGFRGANNLASGYCR